MKYASILFLFLGITFSTCQSGPGTSQLLPPLPLPACTSTEMYFPEKNNYLHPEAGFQIQFPADWKITEDPTGNYGVLASDANAEMILSITLAKGENKRLKPYFQQAIREFVNQGDFQLEHSGQHQLGSYSALGAIGYSKQTEASLGYHRNLIYIVQISGSIYLHLSAKAFGEDGMDTRLCQLDELLQTLELNK